MILYSDPVIIRGDRSANYQEKCEEIIDFYNMAGNYPEELNLRKPESTCIIAVPGVPGGMLLDHHSQEGFWRIMFAAFPTEYQGRGLLRRSLQMAEDNGINIAVVERAMLGTRNTDPIWKHFGFVHETMVGLCPCLAKDEVMRYSKHTEGLDLDYVLEALRADGRHEAAEALEDNFKRAIDDAERDQ